MENESNGKYATHVRLTKGEFDHLVNDQQLFGKSLPQLLKYVYFVGPLKSPLLPADQYRIAMRELGRIGNNMNQIARHFNSSANRNGYQEFTECQRLFAILQSFIGANGGGSFHGNS